MADETGPRMLHLPRQIPAMLKHRLTPDQPAVIGLSAGAGNTHVARAAIHKARLVTDIPKTSTTGFLRRLPLIAILIVAVVGAFTLRDYLSFETLRENREVADCVPGCKLPWHRACLHGRLHRDCRVFAARRHHRDADRRLSVRHLSRRTLQHRRRHDRCDVDLSGGEMGLGGASGGADGGLGRHCKAPQGRNRRQPVVGALSRCGLSRPCRSSLPI